jgi:hypothetical protein
MCDYRRDLDCWMDLLATINRNYGHLLIADFHTLQIAAP